MGHQYSISLNLLRELIELIYSALVRVPLYWQLTLAEVSFANIISIYQRKSITNIHICKMLRGKLLKTEGTINVYKKTKSKSLGETVYEINIDSIPLNFLLETVIANPDDPLLYGGYVLSEEQIIKLNTYLQTPIIPNLKSLEYCLECYGIYDWKDK
jgi:hypothetical protein